jgi:hypothetical protein
MVVLSFLKLMQLRYVKGIDAQRECDKYFKYFYEDWKNALSFYSQPFKPELITELFEGWEANFEICSKCTIKNLKDYSTFDFWVDIWNNYILWEPHTKGELFWNLMFPRTLDDFINDCQRAGIELKWRVK